MKEDSFGVNWIDLVIAGLLVVGLFRGRKRGMSEELLDVLKWTIILVLAGFAYEPFGRMISSSTMFGLLSCYVTAYLLIMLTVVVFFAYVRQRVGDKLLSSDAFGGAEYYFGMMAGVYRYLCVILVCMAFLNARYYSTGEIRAQARFQQDNFGDIRFPTLGEFQQSVFHDSLMGRLAQDYLNPLFIRPTAPSSKGLGGDSSFHQRDVETYNFR